MSETDIYSDSGLPPLVTMGDPRLAQPSPAVQEGLIRKPAFQEQLAVLLECMEAYSGIGIAAPQIGWFERVFLMTEGAGEDEEEDEVEAEVLTFINPEVVWQSDELNWAWEGCLSVPNLRGWIRRPAAVSVRALDEAGEPVSREFTGWPARVFQHEFDHLEGMLYPYRTQDARHLVSLDALEFREEWPADWPAPGARDTPMGEVLADGTGSGPVRPCP